MEEITSINNEIKIDNPLPKKFFTKDTKKNLILLGITILIVALFLEIFLRMYYPQRLYNDCYEYSYRNLSNLEVQLDSHLGWKLIPNFSGCRYQPDTNKIVTKTHNSNGLRINKDIPYENKDGEKRVLLLGDSFVYGYGLDDNETIALRLQEDLGDGYKVIPMGVDGYGTGQELLQFYEEGLKYHPDIVLLFFYPNDFTDTQSKDIYFADRPEMHLVGQVDVNNGDSNLKWQYIANELSKDNPSFVLLDHVLSPESENYSLNDKTILISNYPTQMVWNKKYGPNKAPLSLNNPISSLFLRYSHLYSFTYSRLSDLNINFQKIKYANRISDYIDVFYEKNYGEVANVGTILIPELFGKLKTSSEKENYKFVVVGIPEKRGVNEDYQNKFLSLYSDVNASQFDFRKIDEIFSVELPSKNINYISLYNLAGQNFDKFYFKTDPHWNPNGVKLSADYITEELKKKGLD